jgi:hypothetical protein
MLVLVCVCASFCQIGDFDGSFHGSDGSVISPALRTDGSLIPVTPYVPQPSVSEANVQVTPSTIYSGNTNYPDGSHSTDVMTVNPFTGDIIVTTDHNGYRTSSIYH